MVDGYGGPRGGTRGAGRQRRMCRRDRSTHTGGLGAPARLDCEAYGHAALAHYRELGLAFDCIYTGYLGSEALVDLAAEAFRLWPDALKVVDPVMADGGRPYSGFAPSVIDKVRDLGPQASLIPPNLP